MVKINEDFISDDDENEINPKAHKKLLDGVGRLTRTNQFINKPTRFEPTIKSSEFNLVKTKTKTRVPNSTIAVHELANILKNTSSHVELCNQLNSTQRNRKVLKKPLEKPVAERIERKINYNKARDELKRWDAIVSKNKNAEQLSFPLNNEEMKINENTPRDVNSFRIKSDLMKKLEVFTPVLEKSEENPDDKNKIKLTLKEMMEKRKEIARMRVKESYQIAKSRQINKIKSKKYHRLLKRDKIKKQIKDFEQMQKDDPEAALKQLELIDRNRIEERANLRHKNTGTWAKNLQMRAKYNKDVRKELAEQLSISRDLTKKQNIQDSDSSENDENDEEGADVDNEDARSVELNKEPNPWVDKAVEQSSEIVDFLGSYRKYWETKNSNEKKIDEFQNEKIDNEKSNNGWEIENIETSEKNKVNGSVNKKASKLKRKSDKIEEKLATKKEKILLKQQKIQNKSANNEIKNSKGKKLNKVQSKNIEEESASDIEEIEIEYTSESENESKKCKLEKKIKNDNEMKNSKIENKKLANKIQKTENLLKEKITKTKTNSIKAKVNQSKNNLLNKNVTEEINQEVLNDDNFSVIMNKNKKRKLKNETNNKKNKILKTLKSVQNVKSTKTIKSNSNIDDMFNKIEDSMELKVKKKLAQIRKLIKEKKMIELSDEEEQEIDLSFKQKAKRPVLDEKLDEQNKLLTDDENDDEMNELKKNKNFALSNLNVKKKINNNYGDDEDDNNKEIDCIDPNKFIKVIPKILKSALPDMTSIDDEIDENDPDEDFEKKMVIAEAFEEDDIITDFVKEKENIKKQDQPDDIDVTLPGWGNWAGSGTVPRKNKRFILKLPKDLPRRDDNKDRIIINEDGNRAMKSHLVSQLPFPFTSVKDYEASIRSSIGTTFVPETAHRALTRPALTTQMGTIIQPMDESSLVENKKIVTFKTKTELAIEKQKELLNDQLPSTDIKSETKPIVKRSFVKNKKKGGFKSKSNNNGKINKNIK